MLRSLPSVHSTLRPPIPRTPRLMITSLGRTVPPFTSCRVEWCRRALATSARAQTSSTSPLPPKKKTDPPADSGGTKNSLQRLFVRPWDGVPAMPDGFAMLRGIEKKYGKVKTFKFIRDGEVPSTYFSYFWVELEDPSKFPNSASTVLQIPIPKVERKRPGGVGILDLQPFLRQPPEAQEESLEWTGVTERMVDEVDESKRTNKVYDLRLEPSWISNKPLQTLEQREYFKLTMAFMRWGGFASSPAEESGTAGPSARPTFDHLIARASQSIKIEKSSAPKEIKAPVVEEEPRKPFNYEFDEPVHFTDKRTSTMRSEDEVSPIKFQSLSTMQPGGKRLSRKQKALLQAAAISRTPLPNLEEKTFAEAKEKEEREAAEGDTAPEEERKQIQSRVWNLIKNKWF
ncbi:hypothetical protein BJ322DRAFT_218328 [Thelephora terrestris]|uniref:Uncharacterized protein n=1 Tax=Thelephora terrestris TaxID=56493 RepID=A0A9P6L4K2_9AGAM|nr:hypothetical protein BJ322DRAFT_218328 [Thelephora terrestris]